MKFLLLSLGLVTLLACSNDNRCEECEAAQEADTLAEVEDISSAMARDTVISAAPTKEQKENHEKIVKKYGEQWDFCTCIVANDSITDAAENGKLTDAQYEKLMARWDYVEKKCKELTTFDNTTPEERAKHEKRVLKCLKENGLKK